MRMQFGCCVFEVIFVMVLVFVVLDLLVCVYTYACNFVVVCV